MHLFSQSLSIVLRCGSLLLDAFSLWSERCIRRPVFALIRVSCRCVIDVMLLHCVCCTKLIRTRMIVCSVSFHLILSELDIPGTATVAHPLKLEVSRSRTSQFAKCFMLAQLLVCGMTFPTLCLTTLEC